MGGWLTFHRVGGWGGGEAGWGGWGAGVVYLPSSQAAQAWGAAAQGPAWRGWPAEPCGLCTPEWPSASRNSLWTHTHIHTHTHTHIHAHTYTYIYIHTHTNTHTHANACTHTHTHTHTVTHAYRHTHAQTMNSCSLKPLIQSSIRSTRKRKTLEKSVKVYLHGTKP